MSAARKSGRKDRTGESQVRDTHLHDAEIKKGKKTMAEESKQPSGHPEEMKAKVTDIQRNFMNAYTDYLLAIQNAWGVADVQERLTEAYREYVRAVQRHWASLDPNCVDVMTMQWVCQGMMSAAATAACMGIGFPRVVVAPWTAGASPGR